MKPNVTSQEIETRLGAVRARIRRVQTLRGIAVVGTIALAGLILIMAADYFLAPLPVAARWALFIAWLLSMAVAAKFGFAPLCRKIGLIQIARWLEGRHPEIEERLSTVLELSHEGSNVSPGFLEALATAAEKDIGTVDPFSEVRSAQTRRRWGRPALALLAALILCLVIWPSEAGRLLVRAVAPFSDLGNVGAASFTVTPGNLEVLEGDRIEIEIDYTGRADRLDLWMERKDGSKFSQALTRTGDGFRYVLDPAREGFRYRVRAGRDESDAYTATVWPLPEILKPEVTLKYPEYAGIPDYRSSLGRGVEAVNGTAVTLAGATNTAIEAAWLEIAGQRVAEGTIESAASGGRVAFSWTLETGVSGEAVAKLRHRLGREIDALRFQVEVLEDKPPFVLLISPSQRELRVRPDEVFNMRYEVTEDFGLSTLSFEVEAGETKALPQDLPLLVRGSKPQRFRGSGEVVVGSLRSMFNGANEMRIRVKATDALPENLGGPGIGYSEWVRLHVDQSAESFARQELRQEHDGARDTIEEAIRDAREARDRMDWNRDQIKNDQLNPDAQKHFQEAAEKLASAEEKLNELTPRMEESVHAAKADSVEKAAEKLEKSRESLESAPLQDTAEQRQEKLAEARQAAEDAIQALEAVRQKMDEDRERVQDLARVQELAQQQRELARQAEENLTQLAENQPTPEDWQQRQQQMEEALRQQLRERTDARADALQAQAEQAQALAEEARAIAENQQDLQQQTEQMARIPDPAATEEAAREAIAKEQAAITEEAKSELAQAGQENRPPADSLPEATAAAEQAQEQFSKGEDQAAADSAETAAEAMKEAAAQTDPAAAQADPAAAQAESLENLAERQEAVAEAMEALANGDPAAALQAMQEAQSQGLEESIRDALAEAQADIAADAKAELAQARQERNNLADSLPEAAGAAEQAQEQIAAAQDQAAAETAQAAAEAMNESAAQADPSSTAEAAQAESLQNLAERQKGIAEALEALAEGNLPAALQAMQEAQAAAAGELAEAIQSMPTVENSGPMNEAAQNAAQGTEKAQAAAQQGQQGEQQQAAAQHEQAGQNFEMAAAALDRAAEEFSQAAQQAASQTPDSNKAPIPAGELSEAFQQASQAAQNAQPAAAAMQAAAAAQALSQAAQAGRQQMQGLQPGMPGMPGQPGMPGMEPGLEVSDDPNRPGQASPGLPPELAKLGISAADWEKIQATLNADVGAGGADAVPEEYRGLVKGYFESMSKTTQP